MMYFLIVLFVLSYVFFLRIFCIFFFKQKTAYEMRISDWSSDVCSSDLRLGFVGKEQADVAGFGLRPAQPQSQPDPVDLVGILPSGQAVAGPPPAEPPFSRSRMLSRDCEIGGPPRRSISARNRAIVQFGRFSTGSEIGRANV